MKPSRSHFAGWHWSMWISNLSAKAKKISYEYCDIEKNRKHNTIAIRFIKIVLFSLNKMQIKIFACLSIELDIDTYVHPKKNEKTHEATEKLRCKNINILQLICQKEHNALPHQSYVFSMQYFLWGITVRSLEGFKASIQMERSIFNFR